MPEITLMPSIGISSTGLAAESRRMEVIANNVANAQTTHGEDGKVYRRREVIFAAKLAEAMSANGSTETKLQGVNVEKVIEDTRPMKQDYRPGHPDADENGFVTMPNVNPIEEMVDMMSASRAYEANLSAIRTAKSMAQQALEIMK